MKKQLFTLSALLMMATAATAQTAKLTVEQNGAVTLSRDIGEVQRVDLTGANTVSIIAKDGTVLASNLSKTGLKLNFTNDVPTAVKAVETTATTGQTPLTVRKRIIDGHLVIESADGKTYNANGTRLK